MLIEHCDSETTFELFCCCFDCFDCFHSCLIAEPSLQSWLLKTKGISLKTTKEFKIGYNGSRFCFPVQDSDGNYINIRMYSSSSTPKCISYGEGFGAPAFFPFPPKEEKIYLMEGESDTLVARQLGLPAYCQTSGAGHWSDELTRMVAERTVVVIYDTDNAGRKGAGKVVNAIKFVAANVKNLKLPVSQGHKDFSDWILRDGGTIATMNEIETECPFYAVSKNNDIIIDNPTKIELWETSLAKWANRPVETEVIVAGKDRAPYLIPRRVNVECSVNSKSCITCPNESGQNSYLLDWKDASIVQFIDIPDELKEYRMKRMMGIPHRCRCFMEATEYQNVERIALYPRVEFANEDEDVSGETNVLRRGYFIGAGIQTNCQYTLRGIPVPDSRDQSCAILVVEAEPSYVDDGEVLNLELLEKFRLCEK